jgi:gas vesicle structural protein
LTLRVAEHLPRFAEFKAGDLRRVSVMQRESSAGYLTRAPRSSGLADVLEILLDRGLVIDAYVRVSLVGIELLTIDLRVVIASVDTYLRFAEAVNRLDLQAADDSKSLPQLMGADGAGGEDEGR